MAKILNRVWKKSLLYGAILGLVSGFLISYLFFSLSAVDLQGKYGEAMDKIGIQEDQISNLSDSMEEWKSKYYELINITDIDIMMFDREVDSTFPITIQNVGGTIIDNIEVSIRSCTINHTKYYTIGQLYPGQSRVIELRDDETLKDYNRMKCLEREFNLSSTCFYIEAYRDSTGSVCGKPSSKNLVGCGYCYWYLNVTSDSLNKTFEEKVFWPIDLEMSSSLIEPQCVGNTTTMSPIKMCLYDYRTLKEAASP